MMKRYLMLLACYIVLVFNDVHASLSDMVSINKSNNSKSVYKELTDECLKK